MTGDTAERWRIWQKITRVDGISQAYHAAYAIKIRKGRKSIDHDAEMDDD